VVNGRTSPRGRPDDRRAVGRTIAAR